MSTILQIHSSANVESSNSRKIGDELVKHLQEKNPGTVLKVHDLVTQPVPHVGPDFTSVLHSGNPDAPGLALSNQLIEEFLSADTLVIEAAMYNFTIPSSLKAWIDHVVRAGKTFSYANGRPEGLVKGKKLYLVLARGGIYSGDSPMAAYDFQEPYLKAIFGFIGLTDVEVIRIEGSSMGAEQLARSLEQARQQINTLVPA